MGKITRTRAHGTCRLCGQKRYAFTLCAMRGLAKLAEPAAPGEKRLPPAVAPSPEDF
jgi:hypothetical protein